MVFTLHRTYHKEGTNGALFYKDRFLGFTIEFTMLKIAFQYNALSGIYFTPHENIASVGFEHFDSYASDFFSSKGNWVNQFETSLLTTIGLTASYNSIIGPVDFDISWTNKLSGARYFFGVGYHFNP
jgi:NTE family protein